MAVVPFASVAGNCSQRLNDGSHRDALIFRLLDLSETTRLNGDQEHADQLLLDAWSAYDEPAPRYVSANRGVPHGIAA